MQSTSSVSEGSFLFLPKDFNLSKTRKSKKRRLENEEENKENWERVFCKVWGSIEKDLKEIKEDLFKKVLAELIQHIKILKNEIKQDDSVLHCEILLTGSNLPDHNLLTTLTDSLKEKVTPYISLLWSLNCGNIKYAVTNFVQQILRVSSSDCENLNDDGSDEEGSENESKQGCSTKLTLQSSQYNLSTLCAWHASQVKKKKENHPVVIFFPDFESFIPSILSEFILLLSSYSSRVPFVLIFGVATTPGAVYQSLPRNVLSQLVIQVFKSESSLSFLNNVIEKILFSEKCPFRLGTKCTTFLTDIFLFHSFSVQGFIKGFKFCMIEHYYKRNHFALCCSVDDIEEEAKKLSNEELESIRRIPSFRKHVEDSTKEERKLLLLDDNETRKRVVEMVKAVQEHMSNFLVALKCVHILTQDLPQSPLGRHLREYYCKAISCDVTELSEYKEAMKLLHLQSRSELASKLSLIVELLHLNSLLDILSLNKNTKLDDLSSKLEEFRHKLDQLGAAQSENELLDEGSSGFEITRKSLLECIQTRLTENLLKPPSFLPLHEMVLFDDLPSVRKRISGSPRNAIHLALNNPQYYLNCKCCVLPHPEAVLPTLPDISVAYKLHLEFSKIISLNGWLQAFAACVKPDLSEAETETDEEIRARFTKAVSELQFLGFIKPSRSKKDYVTRLTWGDS